jgi:hypothetical protein
MSHLLVFASQQGVIGIKAFWFLLGWLASAIIAQWLSDRKGYGEKPGLASGLLLPVVAPIAWLLVPPRAESKWRTEGPLRRRRRAS